MKTKLGTVKVIVVVLKVAAIIALLVQWRTIHGLRSTNELLGKAQTESAAPAQSAEPASADALLPDDREHRELLHLRNEVRELRERAAMPTLANANATPIPAAAHVRTRPQTDPEPQRAAARIQRSGLTAEWKGMEQHATNNYARALERLAGAGTEMDRYFALGDVAKLSFAFGQTEHAAAYATELLALADKFKSAP